MTRSIVRFVIPATLAVTAPAAAQDAEFRRLELTPHAGTMFFGDLLRGPLGSSLAPATAPVFGVQLDLNLSPHVGLYGHAGYAGSDLEAGLPVFGGVSLAATDIYFYDAGLELRAPTRRGGVPVVPFLQIGAGAMRHEIDLPLVALRATNTAFNAGIGLDLQLTPAIGIRAMAKDYFGRFDFEEATLLDLEGRTAHNVGLSLGLKVGF